MEQDDAAEQPEIVMRPIRRLLWAVWGPIARRAARAYIAGPELSDALRVSDTLAERGFGSTLCPWHDGGDPSRAVVDSYLSALHALDGSNRDCYLSMKAPDFKYSPELLGEVINAARPGGIGLHFDALGPKTVDRTWDLIEGGVKRGSTFGCTLPASWRRSLDDVDRAVGLGLRVRVVKGQWDDPGGPIPDMDQAFLRLVRRLAGRAPAVAVATHDPKLAAQAFELLRGSTTSFELELLFGLPVRGPIEAARAAGVPVRLYVPYGHAWLPYSLSQLRRHPNMLWWTIRDWIKGLGRPGTAPWRIKGR